MIKNLITLFILILGLKTATAQNLTAKVIDSHSSEPLAYANVKVNGVTDLVTNNEGFFNFNENQLGESATINVSYIGYTSLQLSIEDLKKQNLIIKLSPVSFELQNMTISNVKPDPYKVIAEVKNRLKENYKSKQVSTQRKLFFRESSTFKPSILNIELDKSTGFSKKQLKDVNADLEKFTGKLIKYPPQGYKDILCNYYYGKKTSKENKTFFVPKLEVIKATNISGNESASSLEDMEDIGTSIILKHLDTTKFYRVKSGLFGSRDTISLSKTYNDKKNKKKKELSKLQNSKNHIQSFLQQQRLDNKKMEFISDSEAYNYQFAGKIYNEAEDEIIYIIKFSPKKNRALYNGTLYVKESDYAVVKCNYNLEEGKKVSGFNLKLILGVKAAENAGSGTLIFKKDPESKSYYLQYAYEETGNYFYINRPLKFIELTNQEKDVVALDIKIEGNSINKTELLNISSSEITENEFDNYKEADFNFIQLKRYDPKIWQNHVSLEPLEEMKQYHVTE
ncbi:carboxypeptidase-like regulatory domain-containing protein [Flavobacterium sp. SM15]|uniref:carboxypeptidase-like regulatory domain-containing protein n=1 Tax=Flavobacterium sp. SM15 TaxID=2908005 RepID=UPI001EDC4687|nr:carboxypeptidase-like regulatory domain-containing protein [Flavobacterium sp. SM15]MCG2611457.1 carboxypeptidase-like regulatory domain-containing protein [Flavobacterium sp. SM15]